MGNVPVHIPHTIDQRRNLEGFPKAGEVIEMRPSRELSLQESRVFNLLIENAGCRVAADEWHEMAIAKLRGPRHESGDRVRDALDGLMTVLIRFPVKDKNGLAAVQTTALLSDNIASIDENNSRAVLRYKFTPTLREIVQKSRYWGRLKGFVIFAFGSRYALGLYEALCLRGNRQNVEEFFTVEQFRQLLGVPKGQYSTFSHLRQKVLEPAVLEVNGLSDFVVEVEAEREGGLQRGKLKGFRVSWRKKTPEEWATTLDELSRSRVGRKARLAGTVEVLAL